MKTSFSFFKPHSIALLLIVCAGLITVSCKKGDNSSNNGNSKQSYSGSFAKSTAEVQTSATGTLTGSFDPATMDLSYSFNWTNLSSNPVGMHIHDNGPIIIPLQGFQMETTGTFSSTSKLTTDQATDLKAGKLYVQIHTGNFPAGEIIATFKVTGSPTTNPTPGSGGY